MKSTISILVTYKGKILLVAQDLIFKTEDTRWGFIDAIKSRGSVKMLQKDITLPVQIKPNDLDPNSLYFHLKLTDDNVNSIQRSGAYRLEFYRLNEIDKLLLSDTTSDILKNHHEEIQALLSSS